MRPVVSAKGLGVSDVIVTNRREPALEDVDAKVFTRDLFGES